MENIKKIYLFDEILENSYGEVIKPLFEENKEYDTIIFYLNSYGGEVEIGYSIIESLKLLKKKIITINVGVCYSMAQIIYLCGDVRLCTPSAKFMIHETFFHNIAPKRVASLEKELKETMQMDNKLNDYIVKRTKISKKELNKILQSKEDYYYNSNEAINNGTVHNIIKDLNLKSILKKI